MAYLTIARVSGDPDQLLDDYHRTTDVMSQVGRDHDQILHAVAKTATGLLIVNVWRCKDDSEAAAADPRRIGASRQSGLRPGQLSREHHELTNDAVFAHEPSQAAA